jgi:hypothetical protein
LISIGKGSIYKGSSEMKSSFRPAQQASAGFVGWVGVPTSCTHVIRPEIRPTAAFSRGSSADHLLITRLTFDADDSAPSFQGALAGFNPTSNFISERVVSAHLSCDH